MRADRGATEFAGQHLLGLGGLRVLDAADIVLVDIAAQQHGVAQLRLANGAQQALACGGVAVPSVGTGAATWKGALCKQGLLADDAPAPALGLGRAVARQLGCQPALLAPAQKTAAVACQIGAVCGLDGGWAFAHGCTAGLEVAVLARIQHPEIGQCTPALLAVQRATGRWHGQAGLLVGDRGAQWHVLVKRLVSRHALGDKGLDLAYAIVAHIVVFHLVIVPGDEPGAVRMHGLQVRIAFVQRIAVAVVLQADGMGERLQASELAVLLLGRG